jgi:hypothetical protein
MRDVRLFLGSSPLQSVCVALLAAAGALSAACGGAEPEERPPGASSAPLTTFWEDDWNRDDADVGDWCSSGVECSESFTGFTCAAAGARWLTNGSTLQKHECDVDGPNRCLATDRLAKQLRFHGEDYWPTGGWEGLPLYSQQTFDKNGYISVEVDARAYCGPEPAFSACFMGLALYNGESNYRELAYVGEAGAMKLWRYEGGACQPAALLDVAPNTFHRLRLDYLGGDGGKWVYYIDDVVRYIEAPGRPGALLLGDPRVALLFVGGSYGQYAEGALKPVRVWTGDAVTQSQPSRVDGYGISHAIRYAQEIVSPGPNVARARLFFGAAGQRVVVRAHLDGGGKPGTLINETMYTADRAGAQDVPLWVPSESPKVWLVVYGQPGAAADLGTSAPGTDPYPGRLLVSGDGGATWSTTTRDLYFVLYRR